MLLIALVAACCAAVAYWVGFRTGRRWERVYGWLDDPATPIPGTTTTEDHHG